MSEKAERATLRVGLPKDSPSQRVRRQRRPTGAPPPLPHPIAISTTAWVLLAVVILAAAFLISERTPWLRLGDRANTWILRLIAEGLRNADIALRLFVSPKTVDHHVSAVLAKLGARTRSEAAARAGEILRTPEIRPDEK